MNINCKDRSLLLIIQNVVTSDFSLMKLKAIKEILRDFV